MMVFADTGVGVQHALLDAGSHSSSRNEWGNVVTGMWGLAETVLEHGNEQLEPEVRVAGRVVVEV